MKNRGESMFFRILAIIFAVVLGAFCFVGCGAVPADDIVDQTGQQGGQEEGENDLQEETAEDAHYYVRTDKDLYYAGEKIYVTAGGGKNLRVVVCERGEDPATAEPLAEYRTDEGGMRSGMRYVIGSGLAAGEYEVSVLAEDSEGQREARTGFAVAEQEMQTDKTEYGAGEDIVVTAVGTGTAWVGLYRIGETPGKGTTSICWYYIDQDKHLSGQSYILQRTAAYNRSGYSADEPFPAGEYKVVLFANDSQSSVVKEIPITILPQEPGEASAPVSAEYVQDEPESGRASGTLTVTFAEEYSASEVVAYWANDEGRLANYDAFAPQKVSGRVMKFRAIEGVMIPTKATKMLFYGKNVKGQGTECFELVLPENCGHAAGEILSEFSVLSDLHVSTATSHSGKPDVYNTNFEKACRDIAAVSSSSDGIFIVGDITNSGLASEWRKAEEIMDSVGGMAKAFYAIGNHDLYEIGTPYSQKIQDFLTYSGQDRVYYEVVTGGYHHLILGSQEQQTDTASPTGNTGVDAILHDDQLLWLDARLEAITEETPGEPVFVYCHQSMYDTIAGSLKGQEWNGVRPESALREILAKYPQVILFNGHSHWVMQSYRNAYFSSNELPSVFNTSSVGYLWSTTDREESVSGSQGYYVRVYADEVLILGRNFSDSAWIPEACYSIKI